LKTDLKTIGFPLRGIRQPFTLNLFKYQLLGEEHIPKKPQTEEVLTVLSELGLNVTIDPRTWASWFRSDARRARMDSIGDLDKALMSSSPSLAPCRLLNITPTPSFFSELIDGGLCKLLLEPTASKNSTYVLMQRAADYIPISSWHLHVDAIEVAALAESNGDVGWETVKKIAADRILEILHRLWNPRNGGIYSALTSNLAIEWAHATSAARQEIEIFYAGLKPNPFQFLMNQPASPDWTSTSVEIDIGPRQIHRLLFALAADEKFLVDDRLDFWTLDLASSALAMLALALTNRYETCGPSMGPEMIYWDAFEMLLFGTEESCPFLADSLSLAAETAGAHFTEESIERLMGAREKYRDAMSILGVDMDYVLRLTSRVFDMFPMTYR
jgi:hypothetical protein